MALLVTDCPRCGARKITFDLSRQHRIQSRVWETFSVCRECGRSTVFVLSGARSPLEAETAGTHVNIRGYVSIADHNTRTAPDHVPPDIAAAFNEGARCLAIDCFNAAAAMFRLALDILTRERIISGDLVPPDEQTARVLGRRLKWLLKIENLPEGLRDMASVVKDDGNEAAHRGTVDKETAEDLIDFTERLLTQLYTEPARIKTAKERSVKRREGATQQRS